MIRFAMSARTITFGCVASLFCFGFSASAESPSGRVNLKQGDVKLELSLPGDSENYRGTRFDHSGIFQSIEYKGISLCDRWRTGPRDPDANDDVYGPCEEFGNEDPLGYEPGKPGSRFVKVGVGILIQPDEAGYKFFNKYQFAERGVWKIEKGPEFVRFTQELIDKERPKSIGYRYTKTVRIKADGWMIEHDLKNIGDSDIRTHHYNHNFFLIDGKSVGPDYEMALSYSAVPAEASQGFQECVELKTIDRSSRSLIAFRKDIADQSYFARLNGHSDLLIDNQWTLIHKPTQLRLHATSNEPLAKFNFWGTSKTICPEPYVLIEASPGKSVQWNIDYTISQ
jgi:hypothetical protein